MQKKDLHFQKERANRTGKGATESPLWPLISVFFMNLGRVKIRGRQH